MIPEPRTLEMRTLCMSYVILPGRKYSTLYQDLYKVVLDDINSEYGLLHVYSPYWIICIPVVSVLRIPAYATRETRADASNTVIQYDFEFFSSNAMI